MTALRPTVTTTCGYCGVGCRLEAHAATARVASISPALDGPANQGHTCLKGRFAHQFSRKRERLTAPLIREGGDVPRSRRGTRRSTHHDRARRGSRPTHGPDAIAGLASSRATNEDCYVMQRSCAPRSARNNIDNCSRVCHSPTSFALRKSLGLSGATGSFADIDHADATILIGANPTEGHPVVGARIKQATLRGLKLVTIDPRRIELADYGVLHLQPRPGTNAAVMLGLAHVIAPRRPRRPRSSARARRASTRSPSCSPHYTPDGGRGDHRRPGRRPRGARRTSTARPPNACILVGPRRDRAQVRLRGRAADRNLALITGKLGRPGSALLPLRGQNNVQGSSDMGALPDTYTAYR